MIPTARIAAWLANNVTAIASDPAAAIAYREIEQITRDIERCIDRPTPPLFLGPCPHLVDADHDNDCTQDKHPHPCYTSLRAHRRATTATCPACGTTHDVTELFDEQMRDTDEQSFTIAQLSDLILPAVREYVPRRTMQHWAATGKLVPTGYGLDGDPRFQLADIRRLRDARPQKGVTGAAARKKDPMIHQSRDIVRKDLRGNYGASMPKSPQP